MAVPLIVMAAGYALQAYGQQQAGAEQAAIASYNQKVKEREAQAAEQRALVQSRKQAKAATRKMSELRAGLGAAGVQTTTGAPLSLIGEQAKQLELENLEIGYQGTQEAESLRSEGQIIGMQGRAARRAGRIGAGATLLQGFGSTFIEN